MTHRILIVDDSPTVRSLVKIHLMGKSYEFLEAMDGESGLSIARSMHVHLIINDLNMPRMDGFTFIQKLRTDERPHLRTVPVVVLSSEKGVRKDQLLAMGANAFHPKPVSSAGILATVERLLRDAPALPGGARALPL